MTKRLGWYVDEDGGIVNLENADGVHIPEYGENAGCLIALFEGDSTWTLHTDPQRAQDALRYLRSKIRQGDNDVGTL